MKNMTEKITIKEFQGIIAMKMKLTCTKPQKESYQQQPHQ